MKRSLINNRIQQAIVKFKENSVLLPPQASWDFGKWKSNEKTANEWNLRNLGWDITDFGLGDYDKYGGILFTVLNSEIASEADQPYSKKYLIRQKNQGAPLHYHAKKIETITCIGRGTLQIQVYNQGNDGELDKEKKVKILINSFLEELTPGSIIKLKPGESIRIPNRLYHSFKALDNYVISEEVSGVNNDKNDNFWLSNVGRFPEIKEDVKPTFLLCTEMPGSGKYEMLKEKWK